MSLAELRGHLPVIEGLWRAAAADRLPHAFLFKGPAGIGKFLAARHFTQGLLCASAAEERSQGRAVPPCSVCGPCKRYLSDNHADVFVVHAPDHKQQQITIHFISHRDERPKDAYQGPAVEDFLLLRAYESPYRVVLIREADRMNEAAQNALLKVLEEPAPGTVLILETAAPASLLQTVRSRVIAVDFEPLDDEALRATLAGEVGEDVDSLIPLAQGSPGRALELAARAAPAMHALLAEVEAGILTERGAADRLWELEGTFEGKTARAEARMRAATFLDLGLDRFLQRERELLGASPAGAPASEARRRWQIDQWMRARQDLDLNMSPEGAVDRALYALHPKAAFERGKR